MKGEVKFIKKQIFGGFNREDTALYVAKIAEERNEEREAKDKAEGEVYALTSEVERLKLELEERRSTISKLEDKIAQSIIIKVVADKDTAVNRKAARVHKPQTANFDEIGDDIPEFEYDPDWYKQYENEPKRKVSLKVRHDMRVPMKALVRRSY